MVRFSEIGEAVSKSACFDEPAQLYGADARKNQGLIIIALTTEVAGLI